MQQQSSQADSDSTMLLIFVMVGIFLIIAWYFRENIVWLMLWASYLKAYASSFVIPDARLDQVVVGIASLSSEQISEMQYSEAAQILNFSGRYWAWFIAAVIGFKAFRLATRTPISRYRRTFNLSTLLEQKAKKFPAVRPVVGLDILSMPYDEGPWAILKAPIDLALEEKLLKGLPPGAEDVPKNWKPLKAKKWREVDRLRASEYRFDRDKCREVLIKQLGIPLVKNGVIAIREWRQWPKHYRALAAVFLLRGYPLSSEDRDQSDQLLIQFNDSFYEPNYRRKGKKDIALEDLNIEGVDEVLARYLDNPSKNNRKLVALFNKHGYLTTLMFALLDVNTGARSKGLLTTADFIWLRPIDRTLWYLMNGCGRRTAPAEATGPWAHFEVEDMRKQYCIEPEVEEGVNAIERALVSEGWLLEENTESAKKKSTKGRRR